MTTPITNQEESEKPDVEAVVECLHHDVITLLQEDVVSLKAKLNAGIIHFAHPQVR